MENKSILSIENLHLQIKNGKNLISILYGINLELNEGEILGIVGESGSGKTMTALSIMSLLDRDKVIYPSGSIRMEEHELLHKSEKWLSHIRGKDISMIFQEPKASFDPSKTCGYQIMEAYSRHHKSSKESALQIALSWLDKVSLPSETMDSYPHELSGGQLQRVMIAIALINEPKILIADEPTTGLDVITQREILQLLQNIREQHKLSIILISHDLDIVFHICDRVAVMQEGKVIESGSKDDMIHSPREQYTRGLLYSRPILGAKYKRMPVIEDFRDLAQVEVKPFLDNLLINENAEKRHFREPMLKIRNLYKSYGSHHHWLRTKKNKPVLKNINLTINQGETLGLAGISGCGKSTLAKCLTRLTSIDSGSIWFSDIDLANCNDQTLRSVRKRIQIVFQDPYSTLNPAQRIGDILLEAYSIHHPASSKQTARHKVDEILKVVGMGKTFLSRWPHQLSGGQRQRIAIARALCPEPELLICDEAVTALDVSIQGVILNLLNHLKEKLGLTLLVISHDIAVIYQMSDKIAIMQNGEIIEYGDATNLLHHAQHPHTKDIIEASTSFSPWIGDNL